MYSKALLNFAISIAIFLSTQAEAGYNDYDNEVDYHDSKSDSIQYSCTEEGFHADPNDCRTFYRCVNWGDGSPLVPFKFECGIATVFSESRGFICTHPNDSGRPECGASENDVDYGSQHYDQPGSSNGFNQIPQRPFSNTPTGGDYQVPQRPSFNQQSGGDYQIPQKPTFSQSPGGEYQVPQNPPPYNKPTGGDYQVPQKPSFNQPPFGGNANTQPSSPPSYPSASSSNNMCHTDGFMEDPQDCQMFYRCVNQGNGKYEKFKFSCGVGTVWDQNILGCNHPWAVSRPQCRQELNAIDSSDAADYDDNTGNSGGPKYPISQSGQAAGPISSTAKNPSVLQGNAFPGSSPRPSVGGSLNPSSTQGISPVRPNVGNGGSYGTQSTPQGTPVTGRPGSVEFGGSKKPPGAGTSYPNQKSPNLPAGGSQNISPSSPDTKGSTYLPPTANSPLPSKPPAQSGPAATGGIPCSPPQCSASSGDCTVEGFFGNTEDCHKFYRCVNDEESGFQKYEFICGPGTAWDQSMETCNYENDIPGCGPINGPGDQSTAPQNPSGPNEQGVRPEQNPNRGVPDYNKPPILNPAQPGGYSSGPNGQEKAPTQNPNQKIPDSKRPAGQRPMQPGIQAGYSSGPNGQIQMPAQPYLPPSSGAPPAAKKPLQPGPTQMAPIATSNRAPIPSGNQEAPLQSQPDYNSNAVGPNTAVGQAPKYPPSQTSSASKPQQSNGCQEEGFHANPSDCKKFYRCVNFGSPSMVRFDFDCGPGTAWDQALLTCNYIAQVASCNGEMNEIDDGSHSDGQNYPQNKPQYPTQRPPQPPSTIAPAAPPPVTSGPSKVPQEAPATYLPPPSPGPTSSEPSSTSFDSQTQQTTSDGGEPSGSPDGSGSSTSQPSSSMTEASSKSPDCNCDTPKNATIVCNEPGFNAHPTICNKFYRCVDNGNGFNVYHFDCPPGTIFDPSISVCNYPESVYPARDCSSSDQAPSSGSTTAGKAPNTPESTKPSSLTEPTTEGGTTILAETTVADQETTAGSTDGTTLSSSETTVPAEGTTPEGATGTEAGTTSSEDMTTSMDAETTPMGDKTEGTTLSGTTMSNDATTMQDTATTGAPGSLEVTTMEQDSAMTTVAGDMTTMKDQPAETTLSQDMTTMKDEASETTVSQDMTTTPSGTTMNSQDTTMMAMTTSKDDMPMFQTPCPMLANLTDEQIVLVCPTGFKRHPKLCNLFYQCTSGGDMEIKILILTCPEGTLFDEKKVQCLPESETEPCMGTMAGKRIQRRAEDNAISLVKVPAEPLCPGEGHFPYRQGCSNAFYKCKKNTRSALQGYLYKCPKNFVYWSVSRRCERSSRLPTCSKMTSLNKSENEAWDRRWEIPVEDRNISTRSLFL